MIHQRSALYSHCAVRPLEQCDVYVVAGYSFYGIQMEAFESLSQRWKKQILISHLTGNMELPYVVLDNRYLGGLVVGGYDEERAVSKIRFNL